MSKSVVESRDIEAVTRLLEEASTTAAGASVAALQAVGERVAAHLAAWNAGDELQAAALIHNFVCFGVLDVDRIAVELGERTTFLAEEYRRIVHQEWPGAVRGRPRARQRVRHFIAAYRDPEIGLLAAAVLWERFQSAIASDPATWRPAIEEARLVLSPFLDMLGMAHLKEDVDGWLWRVQEPSAERLSQSATAIFESVRELLAPHLPGAEIHLRPFTSPPTLRANSARTGGSLPPVEIALLVDSPVDCYHALYWVHTIFQPVEGSVVDHLNESRINGARSLQAAATASITMGPMQGRRVRVNFHICTHEMEEINRWGLAALHLRNRLAVELPQAWWSRAADSYAQIESAAPGSLPETLHVFSPQGQLFRFHRGCTVVDFAYHVHTELADQCQSFYVNDERAEPGTALHHLDLVALDHDPRAPGPTLVWLNAAHTTRARHNIERFLKRRGLGVDQGQRLLDQRLKALEEHYGFNLPEHRLAQGIAASVRKLKLGRTEDLLAEVASGQVATDQILHPLFSEEIIRQILLPRGAGVRSHQLQLAQCCRPRPGDDITGIPYRRHGEIVKMRVHKANCRIVNGAAEMTPLKWRLQPRLRAVAHLEMTAQDEDGLLGDAVAHFYERLPRITLQKVEAAARHGVARLRFQIEAVNQEVIDEVCNALWRLPGRQIVEVRQIRLPPSELEAAVPQAAPGVNPYSRLPVHEQEMFFGRSHELARIYDWLRSGAGNIWLLGQKRVGKTSLLLHLKRHFLKERGFVLAFVDFQLLGNLANADLFYEIANAVYTDLQGDPRIGEAGAPLRALFANQPPAQLLAYLRLLQSRLGGSRLALMLDEFSRTTDAYLQGQLDRSFFEQWRGLLQAAAPEIGFITVVQQQTYNVLSRRAEEDLNDPSWTLMELGEKMVLKSLGDHDVRRLIEWPMRNFLEFGPEMVEHIARLTGGNPFLIQAFCFKLAAHMANQDHRQVEWSDIETVRQEFMLPTESVFAHFLDMIRGVGNQISQHLAQLAQQSESREIAVKITGEAAEGAPEGIAEEEIAAAANLPPDLVRRTLHQLADCDILLQVSPGRWRFASRLFQEWLALNSV